MRRVLLKTLYWLAVFAVALALVIGLILLLESRDRSDLDESASAGQPNVSIAL